MDGNLCANASTSGENDIPSPPYKNHLSSSDDLVTTYEATRAGFVALALEKNRRATPYVAEARALQAAVSKARTPADLRYIRGIESGLLTAAGLSDKALVHLVNTNFQPLVGERGRGTLTGVDVLASPCAPSPVSAIRTPKLPFSLCGLKRGKRDAHRGRFFGKPLRAISRFSHQNAQTPPSPLVG